MGYQRNIVLCKCASVQGAQVAIRPLRRNLPLLAGRERSVSWDTDSVKALKMPERVACLQQLSEGWHCRVGNAASPGFYTRLNDSL